MFIDVETRFAKGSLSKGDLFLNKSKHLVSSVESCLIKVFFVSLSIDAFALLVSI